MTEQIYCVCAKWRQYARPVGFTVKFFSSKKDAENYVKEQQQYYKCGSDSDCDSRCDCSPDCDEEIYYRYEISPVEVNREIQFYNY